jgi:hypothetical protein
MKILKYTLLVLMAGLVMVGCSDDPSTPGTGGNEEDNSGITVEKKNMALVNKLTATWCPPCGGWGWDLFEEIISDVHSDAVIMGTYGSSSSKMYNGTAGKFKEDFAPTAGWPAFCVNGANETEYSSQGGIYTAQTRTNCKDAVVGHINSTVVVGAGYNASITDGTISIEAKSEFFTDGESGAQYKMAAYVMEDKPLEVQSGKTGMVEHHHVIRGAASTDDYGVMINNGSTTGSTFEHTFTMPVGSGWVEDNLEYAIVIWKVNGGNHEFVNANQ